MDAMFFDPEKPPSAGLDFALNIYYNELLNYWEQQNVSGMGELTEHERARAGVLIRLAEALPESLHALVVGERARAVLQDLVTETGERIAVTPADEVILARVATWLPATRQ